MNHSSKQVNDFHNCKGLILTKFKCFRGTLDFDDIFHAGTQDDYDNLKSIKGKIQMDDPVNIQFTSGTTGNPKGGNQKMDFPSWLILKPNKIILIILSLSIKP